MKMGSLDRGIHKKRGQARRVEDRILQKQFSQHKQLFRVGQTITSEMNIDALFAIIMDQTNEIMGTERSTVFLIDEEKSELWSLVATGMKKNEIRIPSNHGVAGWYKKFFGNVFEFQSICGVPDSLIIGNVRQFYRM